MQAVIEHPGSDEEAVRSEAARAELDPGEVARVIRPSATLSSVERVGVYHGMYLLRMVEALQNDYPCVAHFLGDEAFADLVSRYVQRHPSASWTLNRLGARLPEFIRGSRAIRRRAFLYDLARLELAVTEVFDAPRSPAWPAEEIEKIPHDAWETAVLRPIAAFRLCAFDHPANVYFQSVKDDRHDHPEPARKKTWVVVWRKNYEVWRLDLSEPAHRFLGALAKGRPFGKAVGGAARGLEGNAGDQLFRWLRDWVAEGFFSGIEPRE